MLRRTYKVNINGGYEIFEDYLIEDKMIELYVNGSLFERFHCLGEALEELALGNLLYKGVKPMSWVLSQDGDRIHLRFEKFQKVTPEPLQNNCSVSAKTIVEAMEEMLQDPLHKLTGAVHTAALYTKNGERIIRFEDVGRHNAVDKVVGWAIKNAVDPSDKILLCSGRLPLEMAVKSVLAGFEILASKAPVMASAIEFSERFNLTLVGFVREKRLNVYANFHRIKEVVV